MRTYSAHKAFVFLTPSLLALGETRGTHEVLGKYELTAQSEPHNLLSAPLWQPQLTPTQGWNDTCCLRMQQPRPGRQLCEGQAPELPATSVERLRRSGLRRPLSLGSPARSPARSLPPYSRRMSLPHLLLLGPVCWEHVRRLQGTGLCV